jgi:hypothetical protein
MARDPKTGKFPKSDKGPGWGGAAKGFVPNDTPAQPVTAAGPGAGHKSLKTILDEIDDAEMVAVWTDVALNAVEFPGARIAAVEKIFERKHGKVPQKQEVSGTLGILDLVTGSYHKDAESD